MADEPQTIRVQVPDMGVVEFPAGTSPETIESALKQAHDAKTQASGPRPQRNWLDTALDVADAMHGAGAVGFPDRQSINKLAAWLPTAGGMFGGTVGTAAGGPVVGAGGAGLFAGSGEAAKQLMNRATGAPAPATSEAAAKAITNAALTQGGAELVGSGLIAPVATRAATALMQSAVKPGAKETAKALIRGSDSPVVKTLLKEGATVSEGGINKLTQIMDASNEAIKDALNQAPSSATVDPGAVASRVDPLIAAYAKGANPEASVAAAQAAKDEFLRAHGTPTTLMSAQTGLPVAEAQAIKQQTYRDLKDTAYGTVKNATIESQKALARGLKEDIATELQRSGGVDINALNAREGAAMTARDAIAKQVAKAGNRDPVALAWLAHNPVSAGLYIMEKSPAVKSLIARGLYAPAEKVTGIPQNIIRLVFHSIAGLSGGDNP